MSDELKVVAWMKANGTHMPRIRMLNETYLQGVWDFALVRLSDAQSALQAKEAEIAALKEDAARYQAVRNAGGLLKIYRYDDPADYCSGDWRYKPSAEEVDEWCDGLRAAIVSARAAGDGEGKP